MLPSRWKSPLPALALVLLAAAPLSGQDADTIAPPRDALVRIGSWGDERLRLDQLRGGTSTDGYLLRTASPASAEGDDPAPGIGLLLPEFRLVWNSTLPFSLNQGSLFAGQGVSALVTAGVRAQAGPVSLVVAPELAIEQNGDFQTIRPPIGTGRDRYASPFYWGPESADLPLRFGRDLRARVLPGQSHLAVTAGPVRAGLSTEEQWWGPGIRNALVLSSNAGGFPHAFLQTARPLRTPAGDVEGRWIVGRLHESAYFDTVATNDTRALAGIVATLRPAFDRGLTLGFARVVYGPDPSLLRAADVFRGVGHPNVTPVGDSTAAPGTGRDQVFSLFGRWVFPESGVEVYGEWARTDAATSVRDLLVDPTRSRGLTLGAQWATPAGADATFRLQAEATTLEQTDRLGRHVASFYTSRAVPQGYTHDGRVLGAAIGPGGSSQWLAMDYVRHGWRAGLTSGRIRWANDAFYRFTPVRGPLGHDVSYFVGARGGFHLAGFEVAGDLTVARRLNYLFQSRTEQFDNIEAVDLGNQTLTLTVRPASRPRR